MSKLVDFYNNLTDMCGVSISTYGRLVVKTMTNGEEDEIVLNYDGMPIIFPEKQFINAIENKEAKAIVLHPLSESSLRAPSEVQDILRKAAIVRLCEVGDALLKRAVEINHEATEGTMKLNHTLSTLFATVGESVDAKFYTFFGKLAKAMEENSAHRLFNIYLKQHGEIGKNKYSRLCVISSPLYDAIVVGVKNNKLFDVDVPRKKDLVTLRTILEALFPELENGGYIAGSSASVAPTLIAFMEGLSVITRRFNKLLTSYGKEAKGIVGATTKGCEWDRNSNFGTLRLAHTIEEFNIGVGKGGRDSDEPQRVEEVETKTTRSVTESALTISRREESPREESRREDTRSERSEGNAKPFWEQDDRDDRRRDDYRRDDRDRRDDYRRRDDRRDDYRRDDRRRDDYRRDDYRRDDYRDDRRSRYPDDRSGNDRPFWDR